MLEHCMEEHHVSGRLYLSRHTIAVPSVLMFAQQDKLPYMSDWLTGLMEFIIYGTMHWYNCKLVLVGMVALM